MKHKYQNVYQFKITLKGSKPPIWRRIQVPENYSFWDLHVAIQDAMGWEDCHLHEFQIYSPRRSQDVEIGLPEGNEYLKSYKEKINEYFGEKYTSALYWYDFGDDWYHTLKMEKIQPADEQQSYPVCLAGKMACPPEDCGGLWGYYSMLEVLDDPDNEEYEDVMEWLGDDFDPTYFNVNEVIFDNPKQRLRYKDMM